MDTCRESKIKVLMLPWLAHGHTSPFLQLAKKLTHKNFHIYFCSTPVILTSINQKLSTTTTTTTTENNYSLSIQLVPLHLPSSPSLPPHHHTTNGLPPHLMTALKSASDAAGPHFADLLETHKPDLVIYDHNQPWAAEAASSLDIPATQFLTSGATSTSFVLHLIKNPGIQFPFPKIFLSSFKSMMTRDMAGSSPEELMKDRNRYLDSTSRSCEIIMIKSFRDLEGKYLDYLSVLSGKKIVPVGSLIESPNSRNDEDSGIMDWLDKKGENSTVFVSFGSECFLIKEEIEELANGLELSGVNFIWVVRFPLGEERRAKEEIPKGFLERVGERGMVVDGWAPQGRILAHKSIGGFVSHCGWSSLVEGLYFGVPIIAMPMQLDQPLNAKLVEEVGVGVEVKRDDNEKFRGIEIAEVIGKVLGEESGEGVRMKAREFREEMRRRGEEEVDGAVEELVKLCRERKVL